MTRKIGEWCYFTCFLSLVLATMCGENLTGIAFFGAISITGAILGNFLAPGYLKELEEQGDN